MTEIPQHIRIGRDRWRIQLKTAIKDRCVCEKKLSEKCGITTKQMQNIISGEAYCKETTFKKINDALEIKNARFFFYRKKRSDAS